MKNRLTIGTKFTLLLVTVMAIAVGAVAFNATYSFKRDNINNIYVSADLITASKAAETRFWLYSMLKKGEAIANALIVSRRRNQEFESSKTLLSHYAKDGEIIAVQYYDAEGKKQTWDNAALLKAVGYSDPKKASEFLGYLRPNPTKMSAGLPETRGILLPNGEMALAMNIPIPSDKTHRVLSLGFLQRYLTTTLADSGPYRLAVFNLDGELVAPVNPTDLKVANQGLRIPIVKKMVTSRLQREFHEFTYRGESFLGSYARTGTAGLAVVSMIPKITAFETGYILVKRSILIALLVFAVSFIVSYFFVEGIVSPIRKLKAATREITKGNFDVHVDVHTQDELLDLSASFNSMSQEISKKIANLSKINEASQKISSILEPSKLMEFSADTLMSLLNCKRAICWYENDAANSAQQLISIRKNWYDESQISIRQISEKLNHADHITKLKLDQNTTALVAPIREKSKVSGYLVLADRDENKEFQEEDFFTAGTILASAGTAFENIQLLHETADKARMEKELETAKHVQDTMFPPSSVRLSPLSIESYYTPSAECGGDWWGCMELSDNKVLVAIGDATGHGVPAAMVTATAKATFSVLHGLGKNSSLLAKAPHVILHLLNKAIHESTRGKIMMTFFIAVIDRETGEVNYANASHDPVFWYKMPENADPYEGGSKENIDILASEPGPRLGQEEKAFYQQGKIQLNSGDFLVFYTDGIPEGKNPAGEEYSDRKFTKSILRHAHKPTTDLRDGILADFWQFADKEPLHDDLTLVTCQYSRKN